MLIIAAAPGQFVFFRTVELARTWAFGRWSSCRSCAPWFSHGKASRANRLFFKTPLLFLAHRLDLRAEDRWIFQPFFESFASIPRQWPGAAECRFDDSCLPLLAVVLAVLVSVAKRKAAVACSEVWDGPPPPHPQAGCLHELKDTRG